MQFCTIFLTCANEKEAEKIVNSLLSQKLIVCAKELQSYSSFLWNGKKETENEILIVMDSIEENFEIIREEVKKIHSYNTFVLYSIPISQMTLDAKNWIKDEIEQQ